MRSKLKSLALVAACAVATLAASQCTSSRSREAAPETNPLAGVDTAWTPQSNPEHIAAWAQRRCADRQDCLEKALVSVIEPAGVDKAIAALKVLAARDPSVAREGHVFAHGIGIAAYKSPETVGEQFGKCTTDFQSGCYHGVIQGYFADSRGGEGGVNKAKLDGLCADYRTPDKRWLQFQCAHGIGHGLMAVQAHHLLKSLDSCDLLGDHFEQQACWGGAFMENVVNATNPHHTAVTQVAGQGGGEHAHGAHGGSDAAKPAHAGHDTAAKNAHAGHGAAPAGQHAHAAPVAPPAAAGHDGHHGAAGGGHHGAAGGAQAFKALDDNDPLYPCTVVKAHHRQACYLMQTSAILYRNNGDFKDAAAKCQTAPAEMQRTCFISLGRDANSWGRGSRERAVQYCLQAPAVGQPYCVIGVVKNVVDVTADYRDGLSFCRLVPDGSKPACYHAVGQQIAILDDTREGRERACATAAQGYVAECRRGANLPLVATD